MSIKNPPRTTIRVMSKCFLCRLCALRVSKHRARDNIALAQKNYKTATLALAPALRSERTHCAPGPSEGHERLACAGHRNLNTSKTYRHDALYWLSNQSLDCSHRQLVDRRDDRDCLTLLSRSARATHSVYVVFRNSGHVVINHV